MIKLHDPVYDPVRVRLTVEHGGMARGGQPIRAVVHSQALAAVMQDRLLSQSWFVTSKYRRWRALFLNRRRPA